MDMGKGEESVRCMERVTWKLTFICKIDSQWEFSQETQTGALYQPRGVDGEGDGRELQNGGDICILTNDSC